MAIKQLAKTYNGYIIKVAVGDDLVENEIFDTVVNLPDDVVEEINSSYYAYHKLDGSIDTIEEWKANNLIYMKNTIALYDPIQVLEQVQDALVKNANNMHNGKPSSFIVENIIVSTNKNIADLEGKLEVPIDYLE